MAEIKLAYPAISKKFVPFGRQLAKFFPTLAVELYQAELEFSVEEYLSLLFVYAGLVFFFTTAASDIVFLALGSLDASTFLISLGLGALFAMVAFSYFFSFPRLVLGDKIRGIEKTILYAMRHLLIKIKAGMPLYNAMVSIASGPYGTVSEEFQKAVKQINSGASEEESIEKLALRNPSFHFRRTVWQIANSLRAGSDFSPVLESIVNTLSWEQRTLIRKFGSELNSIALMYLMTTIIFPALSITFLIVMGSFAGFKIPETIFYLVTVALVIFQVFFIQFLKVRRPVFEE